MRRRRLTRKSLKRMFSNRLPVYDGPGERRVTEIATAVEKEATRLTLKEPIFNRGAVAYVPRTGQPLLVYEVDDHDILVSPLNTDLRAGDPLLYIGVAEDLGRGIDR